MNNYTGRPRFNGTLSIPPFAPEKWNVFERTLNAQDRTNNYAEAAHRKIQCAFNCDHPSIWSFIDGLRLEQKSVDADLAKFIRGEDPPPKAPKYRDADKRILKKVREYTPVQNGQNNLHSIIEFLTAISRNYQMNP